MGTTLLQPARTSGSHGTASAPSQSGAEEDASGSDRIRIFVVEESGPGDDFTEQLDRAGYTVTKCPPDRVDSLMQSLRDKGANIVSVSVTSRPSALALLRAAVSVCHRDRTHRPAVGLLLPAPGARRGSVGMS